MSTHNIFLCGDIGKIFMPVSVAQSDAHLSDDQEVVGLPTRYSNILLWRLIMKYFLRSFSPFR